jgi:hypothetical protein
MRFRKKPRAGRYAEERYQEGLRSWQKTNRWLFAGACGPFLVIGITAYEVDSHFIAWIGGLAAGIGLALWMLVRESPPRYVEKRRDGAEGERKAERALKPLERAGWRVFHDVQTGYGNYDHIVVGPTGVYLIESKNLMGIVSLKSGVPHLARRHDPEETFAFERIRPRALADAARIKGDIERLTGRRTWVQAVVSFWSEFPEGFVDDGKCVFIDGSRLRHWLQERPSRLSKVEIQVIAAGIEGIADEKAGSSVAREPAELSPA